MTCGKSNWLRSCCLRCVASSARRAYEFGYGRMISRRSPLMQGLSKRSPIRYRWTHYEGIGDAGHVAQAATPEMGVGVEERVEHRVSGEVFVGGITFRTVFVVHPACVSSSISLGILQPFSGCPDVEHRHGGVEKSCKPSSVLGPEPEGDLIWLAGLVYPRPARVGVNDS